MKNFFSRLAAIIQHPVFSVTAGIAILAWVFLKFDIDLRVLLLPRDPLLRFVLLLLLPNLLLAFCSWGILTRQVQPQIGWRRLIRPFLAGYATGMVTPANFGVHLRALFLGSEQRTSLVTASIVDKLLNGFIAGSFGIWGLWRVFAISRDSDPASYLWFLLVIGPILALVITLLYRPRLLPKLLPGRWSREGSLIARITEALSTISTGMLSFAILVTLLFYFVYMFQFLLVLRITTGVFNLEWFAPLAGMMLIKSFFSFTWGDLGVRELLTSWLLATYLVPQSAAVQAAVIIFEINILLPALIGAAALFWQRPRR